jgi:hypothetical protein
MRISGDALSLVRVAELLVVERNRLEGDLANVVALPVPSMPIWLQAMVESELQDAASDARAIALDAEARAMELKRRAVFMFTAAGGFEWINVGREMKAAWGHVGEVAREMSFMRALDDLEELAAGPVAAYGATSLEATNAWFRWQTTLPESFMKNDAFRYVGNEDWLGAREALEGPGKVTSWIAGQVGPEFGSRILTASKWAGRLSGPLMIGSSLLTLTGHGERYSGMRGVVDRWGVGGAGLGAGVVFTGALFLPVAPELLVGAGVVALGIAAWQVGNLVYDNREAIKHAVVDASTWVWHHSPDGFVLDHRDDIKQGIVAASQWGNEKTQEAVSWAGDKLSTAKHVGSSLEHGITHAFGIG